MTTTLDAPVAPAPAPRDRRRSWAFRTVAFLSIGLFVVWQWAGYHPLVSQGSFSLGVRQVTGVEQYLGDVMKLSGPHAVVVESVANDGRYPMTLMLPTVPEEALAMQLRFGPANPAAIEPPTRMQRTVTLQPRQQAALVLTYDLTCHLPMAPDGWSVQSTIRLRVRYLGMISERELPLLQPIVLTSDVIPPLKAPQPTEWTGPYVPGDGPGSKRCYDFQH